MYLRQVIINLLKPFFKNIEWGKRVKDLCPMLASIQYCYYRFLSLDCIYMYIKAVFCYFIPHTLTGHFILGCLSDEKHVAYPH